MDKDFLNNICIQRFPTTSSHQTYLMEADGRFFEIGKDTAELLNFFKQHGINDTSIDTYVQISQGRFRKEDIIVFLDSFRKRLLSENSLKDKRKSFLYSRELISAEALEKFSVLMKTLFCPWVMGGVISLFLILDVVHLWVTYEEKSVQPYLDFYMAGLLLLFFVFSSLFHEVGHAAACRYFGIKHGSIGFGLYINIPVFYTDVSRAWTLSRVQRCVVNVGGVYFQMWLMLPFLLTSMWIDHSLCDYIILMTNLNFLITMNPFFKFDGYWLMTDALGVANLRKRGEEWLIYVWKKLHHQPIEIRPYLLSLSKGAKTMLIVYTVVVNLFFAFYFFYIIPRFLVVFFKSFPERFDTLLRELAYRQMPDWGNLQQIILQLLFLSLIVYMIYKNIYPLCKRKRKAT